MTILAQKYEQFISDLVDEDQTGFIVGCQTQDSIRMTIQIINIV